jgi:hypothetical protein
MKFLSNNVNLSNFCMQIQLLHVYKSFNTDLFIYIFFSMMMTIRTYCIMYELYLSHILGQKKI